MQNEQTSEMATPPLIVPHGVINLVIMVMLPAMMMMMMIGKDNDATDNDDTSVRTLLLSIKR